MTTIIWVITWHYSDRSAFGIVKAYANDTDAKEDADMLRINTDGSRVFEVEEIIFAGEVR